MEKDPKVAFFDGCSEQQYFSSTGWSGSCCYFCHNGVNRWGAVGSNSREDGKGSSWLPRMELCESESSNPTCRSLSWTRPHKPREDQCMRGVYMTRDLVETFPQLQTYFFICLLSIMLSLFGTGC
ncbi:hypothetical protein GN956_G10006 [Arapaima gigas]